MGAGDCITKIVDNTTRAEHGDYSAELSTNTNGSETALQH